MIDTLVIYSLSIYWIFHVLSRSDLMSRPRKVFNDVAPQWMVYISQCAFCFTSWIGLLAATCVSLWVGVLVVPLYILAGPVINLMLDLFIRILIVKSQPPVIVSSVTASCGDQFYSYTGPIKDSPTNDL